MPLWLSLCSPQLEPSSTILDVKKLFAKQSEFSSSVHLCSLTLCIELCYIVDSVCMICFHRAQVLSWPAAVQSQQREKYVCNKVANELPTHLSLASPFSPVSHIIITFLPSLFLPLILQRQRVSKTMLLWSLWRSKTVEPFTSRTLASCNKPHWPFVLTFH